MGILDDFENGDLDRKKLEYFESIYKVEGLKLDVKFVVTGESGAFCLVDDMHSLKKLLDDLQMMAQLKDEKISSTFNAEGVPGYSGPYYPFE